MPRKITLPSLRDADRDAALEAEQQRVQARAVRLAESRKVWEAELQAARDKRAARRKTIAHDARMDRLVSALADERRRGTTVLGPGVAAADTYEQPATEDRVTQPPSRSTTRS